MVEWVEKPPRIPRGRKRHPVYKEFSNITEDHILKFRLASENISYGGTKYLIDKWNEEHPDKPMLDMVCRNSLHKNKATVWIYVKDKEEN